MAKKKSPAVKPAMWTEFCPICVKTGRVVAVLPARVDASGRRYAYACEDCVRKLCLRPVRADVAGALRPMES